jgi:hypothetical protein
MLTVPLTSVLPVSFEDLSSLPQNNAADEQVQTDIRNEYQQRQRTNPFVERRMRRRNLQSNEWPLS